MSAATAHPLFLWRFCLFVGLSLSSWYTSMIWARAPSKSYQCFTWNLGRYPTLHLSTPSDTQNAAIAVSSLSSITTWTFLSRTTTSSWRTLPQTTCSSQERPLVSDSIPKISIVRPQGCCAILHMIHRWNRLIMYFFTIYLFSRILHSFRNK